MTITSPQPLDIDPANSHAALVADPDAIRTAIDEADARGRLLRQLLRLSLRMQVQSMPATVAPRNRDCGAAG